MIALALQAAAAFNLLCTGATLENQQPTGEPMEVVLRVDLNAMRFCFDDCGSTIAIARLTDTEILFQDEPMEQWPGARILRRVNRESGEYFAQIGTSAISVGSHGRCNPAPFTGFPQRRF